MVAIVIQSESTPDEYRRVMSAWRDARAPGTEQNFVIEFPLTCPPSEISLYLTGLFRATPTPPRPRDEKLGWKNHFEYSLLFALRHEDTERAKDLAELLDDLAGEIPWDVMVVLYVQEGGHMNGLPMELIHAARKLKNVSLEHWYPDDMDAFLLEPPTPSLYRSLRIIGWRPQETGREYLLANWIERLHSLDLRDIDLPDDAYYMDAWKHVATAIARSSLEELTFIGVGGIVLHGIPRTIRSFTCVKSFIGPGMTASLAACPLLEILQIVENRKYFPDGYEFDHEAELREALFAGLAGGRLWGISLSGGNTHTVISEYMKDPRCKLEMLNMEYMHWATIDEGIRTVPAWSLLRSLDVQLIDESPREDGASLMRQIISRTRIREFTSRTHRIVPDSASRILGSIDFQVAQAILAGAYLRMRRRRPGDKHTTIRDIPWPDIMPKIAEALDWRDFSPLLRAKIERMSEEDRLAAEANPRAARNERWNIAHQLQIMGQIHEGRDVAGEVERWLQLHPPPGWGIEFYQ